jgi:hypothetical protein
MLPLEKEAHKLRRRHWLDFPPQTPESESMNSRQQAAITPLDGRIRRGIAETPAQNLSLSLKSQ